MKSRDRCIVNGSPCPLSGPSAVKVAAAVWEAARTHARLVAAAGRNWLYSRGRPIIVEWERDARHSAGLSLVRPEPIIAAELRGRVVGEFEARPSRRVGIQKTVPRAQRAPPLSPWIPRHTWPGAWSIIYFREIRRAPIKSALTGQVRRDAAHARPGGLPARVTCCEDVFIAFV
ncbi:hypothetical protein EVAR_96271_1 [Eumeta japonica]|uniref:Uncharacterized protein n=1 Tax=Eumeta variegata TaxID=151549 RepID=A0A4C1WLM3_EUMVA|nr:hypothetical protein EVAR_96271_1 [Eumeta japonica]